MYVRADVHAAYMGRTSYCTNWSSSWTEHNTNAFDRCSTVDQSTATSLNCPLPQVVDVETFLTFKTRSSAIAEGLRDASCQLKSCQLPRNSAETTFTTSPEEIEVLKLEGYTGPMCNKHLHSTVTRSSRFYCPIGVINKPTMTELLISPVYQPLPVVKLKFSKSTM